MGKLVLCFCAIAGLAGCVIDESGISPTGLTGPATTSTPRAPRNVSPAAMAALPAGISPDFLVKDGANCYSVVLEDMEPMRGVPLRDAAGQPVCDA